MKVSLKVLKTVSIFLITIPLNNESFCQAKIKIESPTSVYNKVKLKSDVNSDSLLKYKPTKDTIVSNEDIVKPTKQPILELLKYIIPVMTLLLGIGINKTLDFLNERKKLKKAGKRWVAEIRFLREPIQKQIESLTKFKDEHEIEKFTIPTLAIYSPLNMEIFKSLDKSELLQYIDKFKLKNFDEAVAKSNSIHGFISQLSSSNDQLLEKYHDYLNESSKYITNFSLALQALSQGIGQYHIDLEKETGSDPVNDKRFRPIAELFSRYIMPYMSTGEYDIFVLRDEFLVPLMSALASIRKDDRTLPIRKSVADCMSAVGAVKMQRMYFNENVTAILKEYSDRLGDLEEITNGVE